MRSRLGETGFSRFFQMLPGFIGRVIPRLPNPILGIAAFLYVHFLVGVEPDEELGAVMSYVKSGDVVIEIGSNKGGMSRLLCAKVGETGFVIACEPNRISYSILSQYLRQYKNALPLNIGLGNAEDSVRVLSMQGITDRAAGVELLGAAKKVLKITCRFTTLDKLVSELKLAKIDILIIDAEGAELEIIEGSEYTIRHSPSLILLVELHPRLHTDVVQKTLDMLSNWRYTAEVLDTSPHTVTYMFRHS